MVGSIFINYDYTKFTTAILQTQEWYLSLDTINSMNYYTKLMDILPLLTTLIIQRFRI